MSCEWLFFTGPFQIKGVFKYDSPREISVKEFVFLWWILWKLRKPLLIYIIMLCPKMSKHFILYMTVSYVTFPGKIRMGWMIKDSFLSHWSFFMIKAGEHYLIPCNKLELRTIMVRNGSENKIINKKFRICLMYFFMFSCILKF